MSSKQTISEGKPAPWWSYTPMWVEEQREAPPLWTWWAPPYTSYESLQTRCEPSKGWAHTTSRSCNTRSGPTNRSWKVTCAVHPHKRGTPSRPMGKYVRRRTCFRARTSGPCPRAHYEGTRPTTGHQSEWSMYQAPRCQQYSSWHPTDSKPYYDLAECGATCGCCHHQRHAPSVRHHCRKTG